MKNKNKPLLTNLDCENYEKDLKKPNFFKYSFNENKGASDNN